MADAKKISQDATRWMGFIHSWLVLVLALGRIFGSGASLRWPKEEGEGFFDDVNRNEWRVPLFTFMPDAFMDAWTPTILGILSFIPHFQTEFRDKWFKWQCANFMCFALWHTFVSFFATIAYLANLGIIFSCFGWAVVIMAIVMYFVEDDVAWLSLKFQAKFKFWDKQSGASGGGETSN